MKLIAALALLTLLITPAQATAAPGDPAWFDNAAVTVDSGVLRDEHGREVVLRGFNVSGEAKLAENRGLPFASLADATASAAAMRRLSGANAVRFLVTWAWVEPQPRQIDYQYLARVTGRTHFALVTNGGGPQGAASAELTAWMNATSGPLELGAWS